MQNETLFKQTRRIVLLMPRSSCAINWAAVGRDLLAEGVHVVERLLQHPSLQVHSWHLKADSLSSAAARKVLVTTRDLGIFNVILLTASRETANLVLVEVRLPAQSPLIVSESSPRLSLCEVPLRRSTMWWCSIWQGR